MKRFVIIMSALLASALPLSNVFVTKAMAKDVTVKVGGDIQAAIDQVSAANVAGRVVLEEGIYDLTETLILKNYVTLVGAGSDKTAGCAVGGLKDAMFWSTSGTSLVLDSPAPDAGLARFVFLKVAETDGIIIKK